MKLKLIENIKNRLKNDDLMKHESHALEQYVSMLEENDQPREKWLIGIAKKVHNASELEVREIYGLDDLVDVTCDVNKALIQRGAKYQKRTLNGTVCNDVLIRTASSKHDKVMHSYFGNFETVYPGTYIKENVLYIIPQHMGKYIGTGGRNVVGMVDSYREIGMEIKLKGEEK